MFLYSIKYFLMLSFPLKWSWFRFNFIYCGSLIAGFMVLVFPSTLVLLPLGFLSDADIGPSWQTNV